MGESVETVEVAGLALRCQQRGDGPALLMIHETAASAAVWDPLAEALGPEARAIAYDRRGWGGSEAPEVYVRTTIEEQAEDAAGLLEAPGVTGAVACGAGLGAIVALELLLRRPAPISAVALVEPPLFAFVPEATEGLAADRIKIEEAFREGGAPAALRLYLGGGLPYLGAGAERIPKQASASAADRPLSLFAELAAVPAWAIRGTALASVRAPVRIVVGASTPPPLRVAAAQLAARMGGERPLDLDCEGLPHVGGAAELAAGLRELL